MAVGIIGSDLCIRILQINFHRGCKNSKPNQFANDRLNIIRGYTKCYLYIYRASNMAGVFNENTRLIDDSVFFLSNGEYAPKYNQVKISINISNIFGYFICIIEKCDQVIHLTHWGRVTHKYVGKLTIIGSNNRLSPGRRQSIIWTNAGIWLIGSLRKNFSKSEAKFIRFH